MNRDENEKYVEKYRQAKDRKSGKRLYATKLKRMDQRKSRNGIVDFKNLAKSQSQARDRTYLRLKKITKA